MQIKTREQYGVQILEVWGDLQFNNWQELTNKIEVLANQGCNKILISWEHAGYVDSSALGALIAVHKILKKKEDSRTAVFTPHQEHIYILKQVNFKTFLEIFDDLDKALQHVCGDSLVISSTKSDMTDPLK